MVGSIEKTGWLRLSCIRIRPIFKKNLKSRKSQKNFFDLFLKLFDLSRKQILGSLK